MPSAETARPEGDERPLPLLDDHIGETDPWVRPRHEGKVRLALLLFVATLYLPFLGSFGLWDPWETHYGAVTTDMVETYDWVSPWWGYKEQIGTEAKQGNFFFSKPILIFWTEAMCCRLFGRGELAIRLPMAILAMLAVLAIYLAMSKIWCRRVGVLSAVVCATSPQFYMISRQAQTDMPFVATMVIALSFLMLALFGPRQALSRRGFWTRIAAAVLLMGLVAIPQYFIIGTDLDGPHPESISSLRDLGATIQYGGWIHGVIYASFLAGVLAWWGLLLRRDIREHGLDAGVQDRWLRRAYLTVFYVAVALSTYAKGLLGFALPGFIIFAYLLWTGRLAPWRPRQALHLFSRLEVLRGTVVCLAMALPWYMAMFARHGWAYYNRFFVHDHFKRLSAGVHQVDSGNFEHFIKWLGIGMFPWVAFVPLALGWLVMQHARSAGRKDQAKLFVTFWFVCAFTLFTLASTKFHHYIFPAMPALAVLVGLFLHHLLDDRSWLPRLAAVIGVALVIMVARDIHQDPQHMRNLMTYKYDRPMPKHLPLRADAPTAKGSETTWEQSAFWRHSPPSLTALLTSETLRHDRWIPWIGGLSALMLLFFLVARLRTASVVGLSLLSTAMAMWSLFYYLPSLSPHWSQKYLFDAYYDTCTRVANTEEIDEAYRPLLASAGFEGLARSLGYEDKIVCEEDVISWLITWRGETYYSYNELQPITKEAPQFLPYLEERNHGEPFYVLMERGKMSSFKSKLDGYTHKLRRKGLEGWKDVEGWDVEVVHDESQYFQMVKAVPKTTSS